MHMYNALALFLLIIATQTLYSLENAVFRTAQQSKNAFLLTENILNSFVQEAHTSGIFKACSLPFASVGLGALGLNTFINIGQLRNPKEKFIDTLNTNALLSKFIHAMQLPSYKRTVSCAALAGFFYMLHNNKFDKLVSPVIKNSIALTTLSCATILLYKIVKDFIKAPVKQTHVKQPETSDPVSSSSVGTTETIVNTSTGVPDINRLPNHPLTNPDKPKQIDPNDPIAPSAGTTVTIVDTLTGILYLNCQPFDPLKNTATQLKQVITKLEDLQREASNGSGDQIVDFSTNPEILRAIDALEIQLGRLIECRKSLENKQS